jgi:hypothetical protein
MQKLRRDCGRWALGSMVQMTLRPHERVEMMEHCARKSAPHQEDKKAIGQ